MYQIQLVWNREFDWRNWGEVSDDKESLLKQAKELLYMGDGACVKKVRVINTDSGEEVKK
jgi:hypothetical protein